jgi:hypothetical protein
MRRRRTVRLMVRDGAREERAPPHHEAEQGPVRPYYFPDFPKYRKSGGVWFFFTGIR